MTRKVSAKPVGNEHAQGRLRNARDFHRAARIVLNALDQTGLAVAIEAHVVLAAVAYCDAITSVTIGRVNQKDHAGAPRLLRDALGKDLPEDQQRRLSRILSRKDEVQYGARVGRRADAEASFRELEKFSDWAIDVLRDRGIALESE